MAQKKYLNKNLYALILAGGVGSRFWPFSRELEPKQFMKLVGERSLLQETIKRLSGIVSSGNTYIMSNKLYFYELKKQTEKFNIPESNIILEPEGKNTAPAIGVCSKLIAQANKEAILIVFPSDHYIKDSKEFKACLKEAIQCAQNNHLVTIGIKPNKPSSGYGYIKVSRQLSLIENQSECFKVEKFLEKPSVDKARKYLADRNYFWNSGMFIWKVAVFLDEIKRYLPELHKTLMLINTKNDIYRVWHRIKPVSVDYGIMEHSRRIALLPATFDWTDLGSWDALDEVLPKDAKGNVIQADSYDYMSRGICVFGKGNRFIATIGLKDLIIADTPDALLVADRHRAQDVKKIVESLKSLNRKEHIAHIQEKRPWGSYTVLQKGDGFKIKLIEIDPGKRLSLQRHNKRAEHWVVVSGVAKVTCGDRIKRVSCNQSIYIPQGVIHRLENPAQTPLKIVEVQTGIYLEEDDIVRFEDDFKR